MPVYVMLMNLTEQGAKGIKEQPKNIQEAIEQGEAMGGKLLGFYLTMGEYDYIAIAEAPSEEVMATYLLGQALGGNVRTKTLKAFSLEEYTEFVENLP